MEKQKMKMEERKREEQDAQARVIALIEERSRERAGRGRPTESPGGGEIAGRETPSFHATASGTFSRGGGYGNGGYGGYGGGSYNGGGGSYNGSNRYGGGAGYGGRYAGGGGGGSGSHNGGYRIGNGGGGGHGGGYAGGGGADRDGGYRNGDGYGGDGGDEIIPGVNHRNNGGGSGGGGGGGGGGGHVGELGSGVGNGNAIVTQPQEQPQHAGDDGAFPEGGDDNPHAGTSGCEDPVGPSRLPTVFSSRLSSDPSCFSPDVKAAVSKHARPGTTTCIGDSGASTHCARGKQNDRNQLAPKPGEDVWLAMGGELRSPFDPGEIHLLEEQCDISNDSSADA